MTTIEEQRTEAVVDNELPRCWTEAARAIPSVSFADEVRPWNWLELDAEEADKLWSFLSSFVSHVNRRYGERAQHRIPPCWAAHGPLVEELTTLAFARWQAFSSEHASIGGAQYWHSYTLPAFYERMRSWLGSDLVYCQQGRHKDASDTDISGREQWEERTEVLCEADVWCRTGMESPREQGALSSMLVPFVSKRAGPR